MARLYGWSIQKVKRWGGIIGDVRLQITTHLFSLRGLSIGIF